MRIVVTDTSPIWNTDNPALEIFKDILLVVCLEGKAVTDKYECFVSPFKSVGLGSCGIGFDDLRYKALEAVADDLNREFGYHDNVIFLTDGTPESLYPFYVIKDRNKWNRLHLCTVSPWRFDGKRKIVAHQNLLLDLSRLNSILYIDSNKYLENVPSDTTVTEVMQKLEQDYVALLPTVVNNVEKLYGKYYFDFSSNSYVATKDGLNGIDLFYNKTLDTKIETRLQRSFTTLGIVLAPDYPQSDKKTKEKLEILPARLDGKRICEYLRSMRIKLAEVNGIEFYSDVCPSVGPCAGTCEKCDQEAAYLREKLDAIVPEDRIIPDFTLKEWEVKA